jgi:hypothetical protein
MEVVTGQGVGRLDAVEPSDGWHIGGRVQHVDDSTRDRAS